MATLDFATYSEPSPDTLFSHNFFNRLTFSDTRELQDGHLPQQVVTGSVTRVVWQNTVPAGVTSCTLGATDVVPSPDDLRPILAELRAQFEAGARGVILSIRVGGKVLSRTCHFKKIKLFSSFNTYAIRFLECRALFDHVTSGEFPLSSTLSASEVSHFTTHLVSARVAGFSNGLSWYHLASLLGETYIWDDVVDAVAELSCARLARNGTTSRAWLSTSFLPSVIQLFSQTPLAFNSNLADLRDLIRAGDIVEFYVVYISSSHASVYHWDGGCLLGFGDSLGHNAASEVLPALNWFLNGLGFPLLTGYCPIDIGTQPSASGSCVVAACNAIQRALGLSSEPWTHEASSLFRDRILYDLIKYNNLIEKYGPDDDSWYDLATFTNRISLPSNILNSYAWTEWNKRQANLLHPVSRLQLSDVLWSREVASHREADEYYVSQSETYAGDPFIDSSANPPVLASPSSCHGVEQDIHVSFDTAVIDAFVTGASQHSPAVQVKIEVDDSLPHTSWSGSPIDLTLSSPVSTIPSAKSEASDFIIIPHTPRVVDLTLSLPSTGPEHAARSQPSTPPRKSAAKHAASPLSPHKSKRARGVRFQSVISIPSDSSSDSDESLLGTHRRAPFPQPSFTAKKTSSVRSAPLSTTSSSGAPAVGSVYSSLSEAENVIFAFQASLGFKFRYAQVKWVGDTAASGERRKQVFRCCAAYQHVEKHCDGIDPADYRRAKTVKTGCGAHVNLNRVPGTALWRVTTAVWEHNHARTIPVGASATRAPTAAERNVVAPYATDHAFTRRQIGTILQTALPHSVLEPRQLTNIINQARRDGRADVARLGGDVQAVQAELERLKREDAAWTYNVRVDDDGKVIGIFWQSPEQVRLAQAFSDVVLNDNAYNRNQYQYSLNIGIIIDGCGKSRNVWYAVQEREDADSHAWVLQCFLDSTGNAPPEVFFSDRHAGLEAAVKRTLPLTTHFFCLWHLEGNITSALLPHLRDQWSRFASAFWNVYWTASPEEFDSRWTALLDDFPAARPYLTEQLYPIRSQWAWPWVSFSFTAGVRTTGRVESENRVNKSLGGPKVTFLQLFGKLNARTSGQTAKESMLVRQSSRQHHDTNLEALFRRPLELIRQHAGPFALQKIYTQMEASLFYNVAVLQLPAGVKLWTEDLVRSLQVDSARSNASDLRGVDPFVSDDVALSTRYILRIAASRRLPITHLFTVTHQASQTVHTVALIDQQRHVCDCMMLSNLGIPCRHFFSVLQRVKGTVFHIGLIRSRWLNDHSLDIAQIAPVSLTHAVPELRLKVSATELPLALSNPFSMLRRTPAPRTTTLGSRTVFHEAQAALKPLLNSVQTQEQLDALLKSLSSFGDAQDTETRGVIRDPPVVKNKGRPRTARLTSAREGPPQGGGGRTRVQTQRYKDAIAALTQEESHVPDEDTNSTADVQTTNSTRGTRQRKCGLCGKPGHNRLTCLSGH